MKLNKCILKGGIGNREKWKLSPFSISPFHRFIHYSLQIILFQCKNILRTVPVDFIVNALLFSMIQRMNNCASIFRIKNDKAVILYEKFLIKAGVYLLYTYLMLIQQKDYKKAER